MDKTLFPQSVAIQNYPEWQVGSYQFMYSDTDTTKVVHTVLRYSSIGSSKTYFVST